MLLQLLGGTLTRKQLATKNLLKKCAEFFNQMLEDMGIVNDDF